ncbi:hypothetical protein NKH77_43110 [Streptomyces sp. M19]
MRAAMVASGLALARMLRAAGRHRDALPVLRLALGSGPSTPTATPSPSSWSCRSCSPTPDRAARPSRCWSRRSTGPTPRGAPRRSWCAVGSPHCSRSPATTSRRAKCSSTPWTWPRTPERPQYVSHANRVAY